MINNIKLVYLASPYIDKDPKVINKRVRMATKVAGKAMLKFGVDVYSPLTHAHPISKAAKITDDEFWYSNGLRMLEYCDELWVLDVEGNDRSKGVQREMMLARQKGMSIYMITPRAKLTKVKNPIVI